MLLPDRAPTVLVTSSHTRTSPSPLHNLGDHEVGYLRRLAQEYAGRQQFAAVAQETLVEASGVVVGHRSYHDPYGNQADRVFIEGLVESMIGYRLTSGDDLVYEGSRTRGPDNILTTTFQALSPALDYWRRHLVPQAAALSVLYNPELPLLPSAGKSNGSGSIPGIEVDPVARAVFTETLDGRAIRSRGDAVRAMLLEHFSDADRYPPRSVLRIASLACGTAEVIFGAAAELVRHRPDVHLDVHLVDSDAKALQRAGELFESSRDPRLTFAAHEVNVLSPRTLPVILAETETSAGFDFIDVVGFLEYLQERSAKRFLAQAYSMVRPGGVLCAANMRDTHQQLEFTTNCVRWPYIVPRSLPTLVTLVQQACGVGPDALRMVLPEEGAYALLKVQKG
jgi:SAM-dependent methyltransferase